MRGKPDLQESNNMFMDREGFYGIGRWDLSILLCQSHDRSMVAIGGFAGILTR